MLPWKIIAMIQFTTQGTNLLFVAKGRVLIGEKELNLQKGLLLFFVFLYKHRRVNKHFNEQQKHYM